MTRLMIELFNEKMALIFDGACVIVGEFDTGFYGIVETTISYSKDTGCLFV